MENNDVVRQTEIDEIESDTTYLTESDAKNEYPVSEEENETGKRIICKKCGTILEENQFFCYKCGTAVNQQKKCSRCGTELKEEQEYCPKCGHKTSTITPSVVASQFKSNVNNLEPKKKKALCIAFLAAAVVVLLVVLGIVLVPRIFVSMEGYLEQGDYEKAFLKAKNDQERLAVKAENIAAVQSAISAHNLKDPDSFLLRDAYYHELLSEKGEPIGQLVLFISGTNSYGAKVSSYWLYSWDRESKEWEYSTSASDFEGEEYSAFDDEDEKLEKLMNTLGKLTIKVVISKGYQLSKDAVSRINAMFKDGTLDDVQALDSVTNLVVTA